MAFGKIATLLIDIVVNTKTVTTQLAQVQQQTQRTANNMQNSLGGLGKATATFFLIHQSIKLVAGVTESAISKFAALEKQILDIQKVAKFENFNNFAEGFLKLGLSLRGVSFKQLAEIGGDLARLGVRGGQSQFLEFLKVAAQFAQTTGDIDTRQAGEGLGKLLQNFGKDLNATEAIRMASAVNKLADEFAVTSGEILTITQKLSGFADAVGLSAQETLGLVTLIKQTGISSTVVESSLTRLFTVMESDPRKVAESLGLVGNAIDQFVIDVKARPIEAVRQFFSVLNSMPIDQAVAILKELELATSRNAVALLNATNRMGDWNKTQEAAAKGSTDVQGLLQKYADTANSASARIDQLKNSWDAFLASLASGNGPLGDIIPKLQAFMDALSAGRRPEPQISMGIKLAKTPKDLLNERIKVNQKMIEETNKFEGAKGGEEFFLSKILNRTKFAEKMAKLQMELDLIDQTLSATMDAEVSARKEKAEKQKQIVEKQKEAVASMAKELEANKKLFQERGASAFQETTKEQSIRERFEGIAKEEKKRYTGKGADAIHSAIDLAKNRAITDAIAELHTKIAKDLKDNLLKLSSYVDLPLDTTGMSEFQQRILRLREWFSSVKDSIAKMDGLPPGAAAKALGGLYYNLHKRTIEITKSATDTAQKNISAFTLGLGTTGRFSEMFGKAKQFDDLLKQLPPGVTLKNKGNIIDMIMNPQRAPEIRGLQEAYTSAIVEAGQKEIDERMAGSLEEIVTALIDDAKIQEEILNNIKGIKPKAAVK